MTSLQHILCEGLGKFQYGGSCVFHTPDSSTDSGAEAADAGAAAADCAESKIVW